MIIRGAGVISTDEGITCNNNAMRHAHDIDQHLISSFVSNKL